MLNLIISTNVINTQVTPLSCAYHAHTTISKQLMVANANEEARATRMPDRRTNILDARTATISTTAHA